ncbi:Plasmodium exported protein, unknown function [Plasmodium gonderi]|uniref:Plasmodium RESA N-terminal domain-containing protein n=1 Tax=Plasmodium gonderi TaxID=77519 RepID=A0A1Y1JNU1_PLAGO|nr:Plasmodium exported protein, unknown function [Plasmodium gonderi]GAW84141.1 Plasmodium exported protein, unknown function [Plasmodium gonderi]
MKEKVRGSNNSLCNYFRKCHIVSMIAIICVTFLNVPNYASTSVIKASSNNKISRCLGNFDEILNERPSEDISTPGNSSGVYFKLDDNNQGGEMKHFFNVEGQLTDMIDSSEELHQNDHSPEVIEEAYDSNEESKENMDNYYNFKEPTETLEESEMDVSTRDFMDPTLDIQNNFYHTKKYGEDPTILSENEKEKLKEYISSLRMKCSDLRNELSEDEVNELIFHVHDNSSVDELSNLLWQL